MRGIRIWHLAALALSVPLLAAAVPSGCTGGLNPNFRKSLSGDAGVSAPIPEGYLLVGIFNETGFDGHVDLTVTGPPVASGAPWSSAYLFPLSATAPSGWAWACDLSSINIDGGEVLVPDPTTGVPTAQAIVFAGGAANPLTGNATGDPLACGTLVSLRVVPVVNAGGGAAGTTYHIFVELLK
jgi:hypothetical protein